MDKKKIQIHLRQKLKFTCLKYQLLEIDEIERKKEDAKITGEPLPDAVINAKIEKPTEDIKLPILYYAVILILDFIVGISMIH